MDIKAPDLGVDSAEVSEIMIAVGDVLAKDDNIILLESDKASFEVPTSAAGKVTKINVEVGDQVSEGMVLIELDSEAADDSSSTTAKNNDEENQPEPKDEAHTSDAKDEPATEAKTNATNNDKNVGNATTYALPDLGVDEAQVAEIMVSVGDTVEADESILLIESDKA